MAPVHRGEGETMSPKPQVVPDPESESSEPKVKRESNYTMTRAAFRVHNDAGVEIDLADVLAQLATASKAVLSTRANKSGYTTYIFDTPESYKVRTRAKADPADRAKKLLERVRELAKTSGKSIEELLAEMTA